MSGCTLVSLRGWWQGNGMKRSEETTSWRPLNQFEKLWKQEGIDHNSHFTEAMNSQPSIALFHCSCSHETHEEDQITPMPNAFAMPQNPNTQDYWSMNPNRNLFGALGVLLNVLSQFLCTLQWYWVVIACTNAANASMTFQTGETLVGSTFQECSFWIVDATCKLPGC